MAPTAHNDLRRATQDGRRLLESEFATPLEGNDDILPEPAARLDGRRRIVRREIAEVFRPMRVEERNRTTAGRSTTTAARPRSRA
jgi:hypothetical protein